MLIKYTINYYSVLNPCLNNNICGKYGKCINLLRDVYCECSTIFIEGKYCDKLNSKGLQTIAAFIIIVVSGSILLIYDLRTKLAKLFSFLARKLSSSFNNYSRRDTREIVLYNLSSSLKNLLWRFQKNIIFYILMILLTGFQIMFIHMFKLTFKKTISEFRSNSTTLNFICTNLERKYLSEELIYSVLSLMLVTYLIIIYKPKRFSNYIMKKYKYFFNNKNLYGKLIEEQKEFIKEKSKQFIDNMTPCQQKCNNLKDNCFFKIICCPCTCCTSTGNSCCCMPFRRMKLCKYLNAIKKLFCCLKSWCYCGCRQTKSGNNEKESDEATFSSFENDRELLNSENKPFYNLKWLIPISPFSSSKYKQAMAVYVAYTYDILNIFMYLYASYLVLPIIPIVRKKEGVLVDFVIQIFQVFLIGFKFYPLLSITDINIGALTYFFVFIYVFIILILKTVNKGLCSRTEVFVKFTLDKLNDQLHLSRVRKLHSQFNFSSLLYNSENEFKYEEMFYKNPSLLDELFGRSDQNDLEFLARGDLPFDDETVNEVLNNRISTTTSIAATLSTTLSSLTNNRPFGFRKEKKPFQNDTLTYLSDVIDGFNNDDEKEIKVLIRNLLENLPLYLSLSYLVSTYFTAFLQEMFKKFKNKKKQVENEEKTNDRESFEYLTNEIDRQINFGRGEFIYKDFENKYSKKIKNHNYDYISNLLNGFSTNEKLEKKRSSFKNIFKNKGQYFRYSKQYITTYTVAFMVIYFFTVFLFRMANVFGNTVIRAIELMYQFIFSGIQQSHIFHNVNLNNELKTASILTTILSTLQLIYSMKAFKKRVMNLNRGEMKAKTLFRDRKKKLCVNDNNKYTRIASQSLHFPGYLIAHLVYGYLIILCTIFILILFFKIVWNFPLIWDRTTQLFLPLIVMVLFKLVFIRIVMCATIECQGNNYRIKNLTAYFTLSYFNFFFDCFLGFMSCINRIWQTSIISCLYVSRLDVSIFNDNNEIIIQHLDKGHLAYVNFAYMEHLYNNSVLNGFCDVLIELFFKSRVEPIDHTKQNYTAKRRLNSMIYLYYVLKTFPLLRELNQSKRKEKKNKTKKESFIDKRERYIPLKNLDNENNDFDYFYINSIIHEPDFKIDNFSLTGLNEVSLMKFFHEKEAILNKLEMRLKRLDCFYLNINDAKIENSDNSNGEDIYKIFTMDMDNSNGLWDMVSTCLIGDSRLTPLLRLMTCYKLYQLKDEFYQRIELNYLNTINDNLKRFKKVQNDYLNLMYNSRKSNKSGDKLHFFALCTVLGKNIKIFSKLDDSFESKQKKNEEIQDTTLIYTPIVETAEKTLFSIFVSNKNRYDSLIPYKKF